MGRRVLRGEPKKSAPGWVGSVIYKHRRCVRDYETRPDQHEAMVHLAVITTMTRRLAEPDGFQTPSDPA
jgi:hypothetical protein